MTMNYTPDFITQLSDNEIFVFGSNLHGMHGGGAARIAHQKFGAEWGVGVGVTGQCYAIPTITVVLMPSNHTWTTSSPMLKSTTSSTFSLPVSDAV